jgi:hypothetical protein
MRATGPKKPIASVAMAIHDPAPSIIMTADQIHRDPNETTPDRDRLPALAPNVPVTPKNATKRTE